jgi:hypothetical protein
MWGLASADISIPQPIEPFRALAKIGVPTLIQNYEQ